jgi:hypothetical protein
MKTRHFAFLCIFFGIAFFGYSQEPQFKWAKTTSSATLLSSATDTLGNVISVGSFAEPIMYFGTAEIGGSPAGGTSMFIVKYNSAGGLLWIQSLFGTNTGSEVIPVRVTTNENGMVAVMCKVSGAIELKMGRHIISLKNSNDKLLVFTISRAGRLLWYRLFEPKSMKIPEIEGTAIELDKFGNVFCTGSFVADTLFVGKDYIAGEDPSTFLFVSRFNVFGGLDWLKTCGYETKVGYTQMNSRFLVLGLDGIQIAGDYRGKRDYYFNATIVTGDTSLASFVAKLNYNGDFLWARSFNGGSSDFTDGLATDIAGNTYITGVYDSYLLTADTFSLLNSEGAANLFVSKILSDGTIAWLKNIDIQLISSDVPGRNSFFRADALGNITLVTHYMGATVLSSTNTRPNFNKGTRDLLAIRMESSDGSIRWVHTGNSINDDWISSVAFDRFGSTYILGSVINNMAFDSVSFADVSGNGGFYILKVNYPGEIRYGKANFNTVSGVLNGQKIIADMFGNIYLQGNYTGTGNTLGDVPVLASSPSGLFISKFAYQTQVSGKVMDPFGIPVNSGMVKIYGFTRFQRSPLSDSVMINADGEYLLNRIPYGWYILYAIPATNDNPKAVPTYYPSGSNWQDATPLHINSSEPLTGMDIISKVSHDNAGVSTMGGMVYESDTAGVFKTSWAVQAKPMKKADVVLIGKAKAFDNVIDYTTTDDEGNFGFYNIPNGFYTIVVDIPGIPHESYYDVTITGNQLIMNLDYLVGDETITAQNEINGLPADIQQDGILIYPNPCKGDFFINSRQAPLGTCVIEIYSLSGSRIGKKTVCLTSEITGIDMNSLPGGMYLLKIYLGTEVYHEKLVVEK